LQPNELTDQKNMFEILVNYYDANGKQYNTNDSFVVEVIDLSIKDRAILFSNSLATSPKKLYSILFVLLLIVLLLLVIFYIRKKN